MNTFRPLLLKQLLAGTIALLLAPVAPPLLAESPMSLLPVFGGQGYMLNNMSKDNHSITGWLPKKWCDNSRWAAVNAVYTQLPDPPKPEVTAVRIDVQAVDEGHLQLTSFEGNSEYKQGVKYAITGWVRSAGSSTIKVGVRADDESHEFYVQEDVKGTAEWKPFEVIFAPDQDRKAWVMFVMKEAGSVDLAGIVVAEKQ
jgi:hypothetical protein